MLGQARPPLAGEGFTVTATHCPLSSLADDVAAVRRVIDMQDGPVLLVGHSWGGAVITQAGNTPEVRGLLYIAAGAPDSGQSFNQWWTEYPTAPGAAEIKPYGDDRVALTIDGFRQHFAQDLPTDEIELLHATQGPFAPTSNDEPIATAAWRTKPNWFVCGEHDEMLLIQLEQDTASRMQAKTLVLSSSHVPMISHPSEVADFIAQAAGDLS